MKILSHRGYWKTPSEKNTPTAFTRSFGLEFGTETDVRDCAGQLVISHDPPAVDALRLDSFLDLVVNKDLPLALNIKADGLAEPCRALATRFGIKDWFVFDMSVPDMRAHLKLNNPVFTRMSEVEKQPVWLNESQGVWLDGFDSIWYSRLDIEALLNRNKRVCIVSPELHKRPSAPLWEMLRPLKAEKALMLCTDEPELAKKFFLDAAHD